MNPLAFRDDGGETPALAARGVSRRYGEREVLKDFSLTLERGGFEALMGPSGSGKSTFLHLAAGLLAADAGAVEIGGRDVVKMSDGEVTKFRRRRIGVVFQAFNLLSGKTVRENVLLPLRLEGGLRAVRRPAALARLAALAEQLEIAALLDRRPEELSGGERQRVAFARALMPMPEVVLADEPTGNLDLAATKRVCELLRRANETEKSAILVVTHDPVVAATAKKVHFLKDGKIAASYETGGDPALVSQRYLETYR